MANSSTVLADLKAGRCTNVAEIRLLRFWEAKNRNRNGELMSLDMLMIDENATVVQGSVPAALQQTFRSRLTEGSVYSLCGFDVTRSNPKYRLTDGPVSIRFNEGTGFRKVATASREIPTDHFRFRTFDQIRELANSGRQLPDVMGELRSIKSTITDRLPGSPRVMLMIRLDSDVEVCVSMFDALAFAFHDKFASYGKEPKIVVVTSINPKIAAGRLYLNGTSATWLFFDCETAVGKDAYNRLPVGGEDHGGSSTKVVHAQKIEPLTISELNNFVISGDPQIIDFLCTAKITGVQLDDGWSYIGCSVCSKKLLREKSSFTCVPCSLPNAVAELRYRVVFSVSDVTGVAAFVGFDKEVAKMTNVLASEAAKIVGIGANAGVDTDLPRSLAAVVNSIYTFQLKLTDFNFTPNHQTFTIARIFPAREIAPLPTFDEGAVYADPSLQESVAPRSVSAGIRSSNGASQSSTSDNPTEMIGTDVIEVHDPEGNAPKKPRVE